MTPQEAKTILISIQNQIYETFGKNVVNDDRTICLNRNYEALDIAIKALEKQIPKKPDYEGNGFDDRGELIYDTMYCPNCGKDFEVDYYNGNCCDNCGQTFDRSIENDWS